MQNRQKLSLIIAKCSLQSRALGNNCSCSLLAYMDNVVLNPLYTGGLFHCYMLDESICHLGMSGLFCFFYSIFDGKSCKQTM